MSHCCASPPDFTVSAARGTTTWRRNTGRRECAECAVRPRAPPAVTPGLPARACGTAEGSHGSALVSCCGAPQGAGTPGKAHPVDLFQNLGLNLPFPFGPRHCQRPMIWNPPFLPSVPTLKGPPAWIRTLGFCRKQLRGALRPARLRMNAGGRVPPVPAAAPWHRTRIRSPSIGPRGPAWPAVALAVPSARSPSFSLGPAVSRAAKSTNPKRVLGFGVKLREPVSALRELGGPAATPPLKVASLPLGSLEPALPLRVLAMGD